VRVSGDGEAEGALVTELALADATRHDQPSWIVLRASKMLASSTWMGRDYQLRHGTVGEVQASLDKWRVSAIAVDTGSAAQRHQGQLLDALTQAGLAWREQPSPGARVRMFVRNATLDSPLDSQGGLISIPMGSSRDRAIEAHFPGRQETLSSGVRAAWQQR
jgi:hypothetical protein